MDSDGVLLAMFFLTGVAFIAASIATGLPWGTQGGVGVLLVGFAVYWWRQKK